MLDKGDTEDEEEIGGNDVPVIDKNKRREDQQDEGDEEEGGIDEEEMLDIAEKCFMKIAEAIQDRGLSVREAFKNYIIKESASD